MELHASRQRLVDTLHQVLRKKAGFANDGVPFIVDNSLGVNPQSVAAALREHGLHARSVKEIFGDKDPRDPAIRSLAERIGGRVIAVDKGATPGEGFLRNAMRIPGQVRTAASVIRLVEEALPCAIRMISCMTKSTQQLATSAGWRAGTGSKNLRGIETSGGQSNAAGAATSSR